MARKKMLKEEKKAKICLNINEVLMDRIDIELDKNNDKRSRFIEKLYTKYIEENKYKFDL